MRGTPKLYFSSLNRNFLIAGVDRPLFFLFLGLCLPIAYSSHFALWMDGIALLMFLILHGIGILLTKADPQMLAVFKRHIHYRRYYAPTAGLHAKIRLPGLSVPVYEGQKGLV